MQGLFQLLQSIASQSRPESEDMRMVRQFISQVQAGSCKSTVLRTVEVAMNRLYAKSLQHRVWFYAWKTAQSATVLEAD
jgi:hypothetical protein